MRENPLRAKIRRGDLVVGTMLFEFATPGVAQILCAAGAEFAMIDMESSGLSMREVKEQIAYTRGLALAPFVRVPAAEGRYVARVLDCEALGVMAPMVETRAQAEALVCAAKFPPAGDRGVAFGLAHDAYAPGDPKRKMQIEDDRTVVIAQIESAPAIENIEEIAAVPGIDVLWLGHNDLSVSMGIPGEFEHPRFKAALDTIVGACRRRGKAAGFGARDARSGAAWVRLGFSVVAFSSDVQLLRGALQSGIAELRAEAGGEARP